MPRVPSKTEPPSWNGEPEDTFDFPDNEDQPIRFDEAIDLSPGMLALDRSLHEFRDIVRDYFAKFLDLAIKCGATFRPGAYPNADQFLDDKGLSWDHLELDFSLALNILDDDKAIDQRLEQFRERVKQHIEQKRAALRVVAGGHSVTMFRELAKDPKGIPLNLDQLRKKLDDALAVSAHKKASFATLSELGWISDSRDDRKFDAARKRASRARKLAKIVTESVARGEFEKGIAAALRDC